MRPAWVTQAIQFQSTPLMRGETRRHMAGQEAKRISIHSPHARGDFNGYAEHVCNFHFNPLPSCEGRPLYRVRRRVVNHFNPLPSCEGRLTADGTTAFTVTISIHSPHARGDPEIIAQVDSIMISIHSPHARGDCADRGRRASVHYFNPLPSCEGRPKNQPTIREHWPFQSTPLMRGETFMQ